MKTINKYVEIFNTLEGATSAFYKHAHARLLTLKKPTGKKDFFVDSTPQKDEQLHNVWPVLYNVLKEQ
jgi:hypothetical protein